MPVTVVVTAAVVVVVVAVAAVVVDGVEVDVVVDVGVDVVVDLAQDAKMSDVARRQDSNTQITLLFIRISFLLERFQKNR